ncbi:MFS general substrate transporter [Schizophyllum commune H4-8]|uniref:MFS general substrate transporter n=1 Tax=Schizophyllum commune (strain H4-8 / FGSC 9210) TaxID=578458 RepID=UPI00215F867D|nr:MFS general substrate transporter [Schizophyllum commune H4-8]KAI5885672.1 MFS general substrate transporter [Schizophyllum commune H4-8]
MSWLAQLGASGPTAQDAAEKETTTDATSHGKGPSTGSTSAASVDEKQASEEQPYPRGRWKAWSTVMGAFLIQFYVVGILTGFGVFQEYYTTEWLPSYSASDVSWIGGVQYLFELGLGPVAGKLYDAGYGRASTLLGSFISMFSFFMLSLVDRDQYYQVFLAQGVGMGLGLMFVFGTTMTMVSQHFKSRRALAMGIVAASSPLGSIMYTILLNHLFHGPTGFAWGMRYVAFATLGCFIAGNLLLHSPVKDMKRKARERRTVAKEERSAFIRARSRETAVEGNAKTRASDKTDGPTAPVANGTSASSEAPLWDLPFVLTMISALLWSLGATPPNFYMQLYAEKHGVDQQLCFYSFAILSFASIFGRIVPGWMADRWGAANVFIPSLFMVAAISFGMFGCRHPGGLVVFAVVFGYFFGTVIAIYMPMVASMTPPGTNMGRRLGVSLVPVGIGSFVGPPISGAILGRSYDWWKTIVFSGVLLMGACAFNIAALVLHRRRAAKNRLTNA